MGPNRQGRKFSFVTDTNYFPGIAEKVRNADFLVCEGMFRDELEESASEKKHLTASQAAAIARDAGGVRKMGLIHYSPRYTEYELKKLLKEARTIFPETVLTRDRQIYSIHYRDGNRQ
jgi:ribonuclease Z